MILVVITILACATIGLSVALGRLRYIQHAQAEEIEELKKERDETINDSDAKDRFVHNLSHEIRTPLNAVTGFSQLLALPPGIVTDEERTEYVEHIQHNSNMLIMLVDDILNISDIKAGNYTITPQQQSVNAVCQSALASVKYRVNSNVSLEFKSEIEDSYTAFFDPRRVQQILINYLTNAIKHTQMGSIVLSVSLSEHPDMITFAVTDTGEGVPLGKAKEIFRRFTKLNDFVEGTGLGLNICLTLSEKMGGQVFLDEAYTNGARFVFTLPVTQDL